MIYFLYLLLISGFIFTRGFFSFNGIFVLFIFFILMLAAFVNKEIRKLKLISPQILLLLLAILSLVLYGGLYQRNIILVLVSFFLLAVNVCLSVIYLLSKNSTTNRKILLSMVGIAILVRLFMIWSSPDPYIDVYDYLKNGAFGFINGQNPYSLTYTKFYDDVTPDFYSYLPGMIYLTLPFVVIFKDPRYTMVFAELAVAFILYKLAKNKKESFLYPVLLLNNPVSAYMIEQSYTEPIILFLVVAFAYLLIKKRNLLSSLILGILLATKQYAIILIPLFVRLNILARSHLAKLVVAIIFAGIIILPFFLWNKADFIHDAVLLQANFPPRYEGLSFFSFLHTFGIDYNLTTSSIMTGLFLLFIYIGRKISLSYSFFLSSFAFFVFFFFNKWAFINYYYLVSQLILTSAILKELNL